MKFSFASLFTKLTLATSVAGALIGCDEPKYPEPTPATTNSAGQARILVVNAAPGTQGVTATLDNSTFGTTIPYLGRAASTYTSVDAGLRLFLFNDPANIPSNAVTTPPAAPATPRQVVSRTFYLGGTNYTVFVTDPPTRAFTATDQGGIRLTTLTDNLTAPATGTAKIRFVNLATTATGGATTYGIFNFATSTSLFSAVPFRGYRAISNTTTATPPVTTNFANFTEVPAGPYTLDVRSINNTTNVITILAGTQQVITFESGKIYTLYTRGIAGNSATPLGISTVLHN